MNNNLFKALLNICILFSTTNIFAKNVALDEIKIGDTVGGGIVFLLDNSQGATRGLIAAPQDIPGGSNYTWGGFYNRVSTVYELFTGLSNMSALFSQDGGSEAATAAASLNPAPPCPAPILFCTDWYLPSQNELTALWANQFIAGITAFESEKYWSSTEGDNYHTAWSVNFKGRDTATSDGMIGPVNKQSKYGVRPVRTFIY